MYRNAEIKKEVKSPNIHPSKFGASEEWAYFLDVFAVVDTAADAYNLNDASEIWTWLLLRLILQSGF